jgi:hypothetical protein
MSLEGNMKGNRPFLLTLLCFFGFLGCFIKMYYVFSSEVRNVNFWYPAYVSFSTVFVIVCLYGLSMMRKWSVWAFGAFLVVHQIVQWSVGRWDPTALVLFLAITLSGIFYYHRME